MGRRQYLDWLRGVAVLIMVETQYAALCVFLYALVKLKDWASVQYVKYPADFHDEAAIGDTRT